jgi:hypothetical protein
MILIPATPHTPPSLRPILGSIRYIHPYPHTDSLNPFIHLTELDEVRVTTPAEQEIWLRWSRKIAKELLGEQSHWDDWEFEDIAPFVFCPA